MDQQRPHDDTWRRKYYDSLDTLNRQEQAWRSLEGLLRQALLQLSTFAALAEPAVAGKIDTLRTELRRGTESAALAQLLKDVAHDLEKDCRDTIKGAQAVVRRWRVKCLPPLQNACSQLLPVKRRDR